MFHITEFIESQRICFFSQAKQIFLFTQCFIEIHVKMYSLHDMTLYAKVLSSLKYVWMYFFFKSVVLYCLEL